MRWALAVLIVVFLALQFQLWVGEGSLAQREELQKSIEALTAENQQLKSRNEELKREVTSLKSGNEGMEGKARQELGLIRDGETLYMVVDPEQQSRAPEAQTSE
ncbi:MAG: FtsB family cell division protein [bacterium]